MTTATNSTTLSPVKLLHHGAAAASTNHAVLWFQDTADSDACLVYASHCILTLARRVAVTLPNDRIEHVWSQRETLRSRVHGTMITCLAKLERGHGLICGFANGSISLWCKRTTEWQEHVLMSDDFKRSVTVVSALQIAENRLLVVSGSSAGAMAYICCRDEQDNAWSIQQDQTVTLLHMPVSSVQLVNHNDDQVLVIVGTAAHRHNKIHIWNQPKSNDAHAVPIYSGALLGHEDWISCFDWRIIESATNSSILASGSQDNKIRLWNFVSRNNNIDNAAAPGNDSDTPALADADSLDGEEDSDENALLELEDEGESRLEIVGTKSATSVFLEALLVGHEAAITSVEWHPNPKHIYGQDMLLISSSMDRSILLWAPSSLGGIWAPLSRVGSAGGILGGSVGSSLLGYCRAVVEPVHGSCLVGHAYGGAMHVWSLKDHDSGDQAEAQSEMTAEERASLVSWTATTCLTGHFAGVTDLCWEASSGQYLLTVSNDQTCRLWAPLLNQGGSAVNERPIWLELGRPQVHGYDLSAITSISTPQHPHRFLSGADEKEIRVFDAPSATLRLLKAVSTKDSFEADATERVERAFIPSLGLTNKATAAEGAEEDVDEDAPQVQNAVEVRLPMERDLGSESIWPEVRKLFGHNTEVYCLASTCAARTAGGLCSPLISGFKDDTIVASSAKARDDEAACIRIWDVSSSKCVQVLTSGHKSTVATMSFSPDGQYLVSSGKDRRLCLWKRDLASGHFALAWAKDSAHKRIIWSVHVCPFDETLFVSGSRDGCIRLWMIKDGSPSDVACLGSFAPHHQVDGKPDAVTALAYAPSPLNSRATMALAVGLESGRIELWKLNVDKEAEKASVELYHEFAESCCHSARVSKLAWKPLAISESIPANLTLASCAMDHGCRLFSVDLLR